MNKKTGSILKNLTAFIILYLFDQVSKILANHYLSGTPGISVIPGVFELFYLENKGAAFGMLENMQMFFILIACFMIFITGYVIFKLPISVEYMPLRIICVLIAAGAAGNMTDRILWNYVIDFLYISLIDFPVFNIADCYVCIGAAAAVILLFTKYKDDPFDFLSIRKKSINENRYEQK